MDSESAINLKMRCNADVAKMLCRPLLKVRHKMQRKSSWKDQQKTDFIDTVAHSWVCPPIYIIPGPEDPEKGDEDEELVFDGAHKLEAVFDFIDGKFALRKINSFSILKDYEGKHFAELSRELQDKIKNYKFNINRISRETADDSEALKVLWERLNKAGQKLNSFELSLPIIIELNNLVLKPCLADFLQEPRIIYTQEKSDRGQAEKILQLILAVSDGTLTGSHLSKFSSKIALVKQWQDTCLGNTISQTTENTKKNAERWIQSLKLASRFCKALDQANCFVEIVDGKSTQFITNAHRGTEIPFFLGRLVFHFKKFEDFSRISSDIAQEFKEKFLMTVLRDDAGRNGILQRRVLGEIDELVLKYGKKKTPRGFTADIIATKRAAQNNVCPLCSQAMLPHHDVHADHIHPWSQGGESTLENCQITHARCNLVKGAKVKVTRE